MLPKYLTGVGEIAQWLTTLTALPGPGGLRLSVTPGFQCLWCPWAPALLTPVQHTHMQYALSLSLIHTHFKIVKTNQRSCFTQLCTKGNCLNFANKILRLY